MGSPCFIFLGVFLRLYFLLILLDYVFVMDFVYVHSSPWWFWCGLSAMVLSDQLINTYCLQLIVPRISIFDLASLVGC
jgi:hypothetical protein